MGKIVHKRCGFCGVHPVWKNTNWCEKCKDFWLSVEDSETDDE